MKKSTKNLDAFFNPKSIALIGASRKKGKIGYSIFKNFISGNFKGRTYPINLNANKVLGKKAYSSILNVPKLIDLAIIVVQADIVPNVLRECIKKKVKAVIIISSGFAEIGKEGKQRERLCASIIKNTNMRVIGPNCIGTLNPKAGVDTLFLLQEKLGRPKTGKTGCISQSGAVGSIILDWLSEGGIGISKFISYGNAMDIDESDLIEYLDKDRETEVITLYIESIKNGKKFIKTARKAKKPILALKAGKTKLGLKAAFSHTGGLATSSEVCSGIFKQCGIIEVFSLKELLNIAKGFALQPRPKGRKLAIVTNGGGFGVLATDMAEKEKLLLPAPTEKIKKILRKNLPSHAIISNPIDLAGDATVERYKIAIESCLKSKQYDGLIAIILFQVPTLKENVIDVVASLSQKYKKPLICCTTGKFVKGLIKQLEIKSIPVYQTPEESVRVFSAMV